MFGSTNKSRLQQQRMRQRTNLAAMQDDDDDDDGEATAKASNVGNNKSTKSKSIVVKPSTTRSNTTGISFAERATNDDDDDDDGAATAATSTVPIKRMVAAVPLSSFVVEDSGGSAAAAVRYTDDDLNALRAQTRTVPTAPRRTDSDTGAIADDVDVDDDVTVAGLPPPTSVRILSDEEIARAKQLKAEARNASAFVALDPRRQPDAPQDDDLMAERIALTVASLQRTASSTDLDHDAEIARWELRNVHAGGGGAHAIGNALRQAAGGKPLAAGSGAANRRPTTDIGTIDALVATDCDTVSLELVLGDMSKTIAAMQERSRDSERRETNLSSTRDETVVAIGESDRHRSKLLVRAARAVEMRDYVTDVLDCLAVKEVELAALEERVLDVVERRRTARRSRRTVDAVDKWRDIDHDSAPNDIGAIDDNVDGDIDGALAHRQRRREAREKRAAALGNCDADDLEDEGDARAIEAAVVARDALADVQIQAATLFDEADEPFRSIGEVCARFAAWRGEYYEDYSRAFAGLSLPALVAPYLRASLLARQLDSWLVSVDQLEQLPFVETMREYPPSSTTIPIKAEDEPPLLTTAVRLVLKDRLSAAVRRTLDLAAPSDVVEAFAINLRALLAHPFAAVASVRRGVDSAIDAAFAAEIVLVVLPTNALRSTVAGAPMAEFAMAQFRKSARLLRNMFLFAGVVGAEQLRQRAIGELLNHLLIPFLRNVDFVTPGDALAALQLVLQCVPGAEGRVPNDLSMAHQFVWMHYQMALRSAHLPADVKRGFEALLQHLGGGAI